MSNAFVDGFDIDVVVAASDAVRVDPGDDRPFTGNGPVRFECRWFPDETDGKE